MILTGPLGFLQPRTQGLFTTLRGVVKRPWVRGWVSSRTKAFQYKILKLHQLKHFSFTNIPDP